MGIKVKHAPSAAAIGGTAYTIGRGERRERDIRFAAEVGLRQSSLSLQARGQNIQAEGSRQRIALQQEALGFRKEQWEEEPSRQLERGLQQQKLLQSKVSWQYDEGQKRAMAKVTTGVAWVREQVASGKWTAAQGEQAERQLWRKYHSIIPLPFYDDKATPQEIYNSNVVKDPITGAQYRMNEKGSFEPVGIPFKDYAKLRADVAKAFTTQVTDPDSKSFGVETTDWAAVDKFVDETMVRFTKIQGFATRAEEEQARRDKQGPPQPSIADEAKMRGNVAALPRGFNENIDKKLLTGRKQKPSDAVLGEEAYYKLLAETIKKEPDIPPEIVKAELDKWWDAQHDKERGQKHQKYENRMEFEGAEPQSQEEFIRTIQSMGDKAKAKAYYDKWVGKWR